MDSCQALREYAGLVENIRSAQKILKNIDAAVDQAEKAIFSMLQLLYILKNIDAARRPDSRLYA